MLTPFGKEVRKLRIDKGVRLKDMAEALDVSSAYLSAIETGKKSVPSKLVATIARYFKLNKTEEERLTELATKTVRSVKIDLRGQPEDSIEAATAFARTFPTLKSDDFRAIRDLIIKLENKEEQ